MSQLGCNMLCHGDKNRLPLRPSYCCSDEEEQPAEKPDVPTSESEEEEGEEVVVLPEEEAPVRPYCACLPPA
jgi:hypothetical protein